MPLHVFPLLPGSPTSEFLTVCPKADKEWGMTLPASLSVVSLQMSSEGTGSSAASSDGVWG